MKQVRKLAASLAEYRNPFSSTWQLFKSRLISPWLQLDKVHFSSLLPSMNLHFAMWFLFGGFQLFAQFVIGAFFASFSVIGLPFAFKAFELARLVFHPSFQLNAERDSTKFYHVLLNIGWFMSFGWFSSLMLSGFAVFSYLLPIDPFLYANHLRFLHLAMAPFGKHYEYAQEEEESFLHVSIQEEDVQQVEHRVEAASASIEREILVEQTRFEDRELQIKNKAKDLLQGEIDRKMAKRMAFVEQISNQSVENVRMAHEEMMRIVKTAISGLQNDISQLRSKFDKSEAAYKKAEEQMKQLKAQIGKLQHFSQDYETLQQQFTSETAKSETRVSELNSKLEKEAQGTVQYKELLKKHQDNELKLVQERDKFREVAEKSAHQLEQSKTEKQGYEDRIAKLQASQVTIVERQRELDTSNLELKMAKDLLSTVQRDRELERNEIVQLTALVEELRGKLGELPKENAKLQQKNQELEQRLEQVRLGAVSKEKELSAKFETLEKSYKTTMKQMEQMKQKNSNSTTAVSVSTVQSL